MVLLFLSKTALFPSQKTKKVVDCITLSCVVNTPVCKNRDKYALNPMYYKRTLKRLGLSCNFCAFRSNKPDLNPCAYLGMLFRPRPLRGVGERLPKFGDQVTFIWLRIEICRTARIFLRTFWVIGKFASINPPYKVTLVANFHRSHAPAW